MNMKNIISITEARKRLFDIVKDVSSPASVYTLTEHGSPKAVVMSASEYESWTETMDVMREFPGIVDDVRATRKSVKTGEWRSWPSLSMALKDKSKMKYGISAFNKTKRQKKSR